MYPMLVALFFVPMAEGIPPVRPPNFVVILCDDLGYGDVACLNPKGKIPTPNMDKIGREGMTFTDAHSGSAVCSPTRYGILTGRYAWRGRLKKGVLGGLSPRLIEPGRLTIAQMLKNRGYQTAVLGKWHVGMDWEVLAGKTVTELGIEPLAQNRNVDYTKPIRNGPNTLGFDYFFGIAGSLDMIPYAYIHNNRLTASPTQERDFAMMLGKATGKTRKGPAALGFEASNVLGDLTEKAVDYISSINQQAKRDKPFFLYLPLTAPHTPILPTAPWQGKSGLNPYADFVMATDDAIGKVANALEKAGLSQDTLLIVTSDNGCSPQADFPALLNRNHHSSHTFRGTKADIFEGGHRVPFLARWPGVTKPGSQSERLVCLTDLMATFAEITGAEITGEGEGRTKLPESAAEDSFSFVDALKGQGLPGGRESIVHHSINGSFAIRRGPWKLALCADSGGWSEPRPNTPKAKGLPLSQLYNLAEDICETNNRITELPAKAAELEKELTNLAANGRSTPGPIQPNTTPVNLRP